ncbi:MAG TPA: J domain-containing protein [Chloroflexia bacterium]|nr:J domain-containing protein [Chloroflexia bacterium]
MQDQAKPNYYEILQLQTYAHPALVVAAYRVLSKLYHPDTARDQADPEKFRLLQEAYETLNDVQKRREYDQELRLKMPANAWGESSAYYGYRPEPEKRDPLWDSNPFGAAPDYTPPSAEELEFYENLYENYTTKKRPRAFLLITLYIVMMTGASVFGLLGIINLVDSQANHVAALFFFGLAITLLFLAQFEAYVS